ncbi:MAG: hypothetical protein GEU93_02580 [Propionibacteriales bacterium]|nr:hypothetical protein [Propionibacteriales bacterium]
MFDPGNGLPDRLIQSPCAVHVLRTAGLNRRELDGPLWSAPHHGVRQWAALDPDDPMVRIGAAAALLPSGCAISGWAAAYAHGITYLDGRAGSRLRDVLLLLTPGHRLHKRPGITPRRVKECPEITTAGLDFPCVTLARASADEMCLAYALEDAVVIADMATSTRTGQRTTSLTDLSVMVAEMRGARGIRRARAALRLASDRSASPPETRFRLVWVLEAGLPPPLVNCPIFSLDGDLLGYGDLVDEDAGVVGEFDGAQHRELGQYSSDIVRHEALERHNLTMFRGTILDLRRRASLRRRMRSAYERGMTRDRSKDRWTLTPPPWWLERAA